MDTGREETHMKHFVRRVIARLGAPVLCALLALLGVVGLLLAGSPQGGKSDTQGNTGRVSDAHSGTPTDSVLPDADNLSRTFRAAAKRVLPAVVVVKTSSNPQAAAIPLDGVEQFSDNALSGRGRR